MITAIKSIFKLRSQRRGVHRPQPDEEGRAIIPMTVRDDSSFLSPYSVTSEEVVDADVAEFIERTASAVPPKMPLALHVRSRCIDPSEQELYRAALRQYFRLKSIANLREIRRNIMLATIMTIVGVAALGGMFLAESFGVRQIWIECIDIFAWVFIWEAVDLLFIEGGRLRLEGQRLESLMNMKVSYYELD